VGQDVAFLSLEKSGEGRAIRLRGPFASLPRTARYPLCAGELQAFLRDFRPHVLNAHYAQDNGFLAAVAGFQPLVVTVWGSDVLLPFVGFRFRGLRRALGRLRLGYLRSRVSLWLSDSRFLARVLVEQGVPASRVVMLPFGVDTALFHPSRSQVGGGEPPLSVSTRYFYPVYDPFTLIRAAARVTDEYPPFKLEMIGDGPLWGEVREEVRRLGLEGRITLPGRLGEAEIAGKLGAAEIYVSASLSDSTSVSLLEAMASGCFPVVSDIPGNRDWVHHGENGLLFRPGDPVDLARKLLQSITGVDLRRRAARLNRRLVLERADRTLVFGRLMSVFEELAGITGGSDG